MGEDQANPFGIRLSIRQNAGKVDVLWSAWTTPPLSSIRRGHLLLLQGRPCKGSPDFSQRRGSALPPPPQGQSRDIFSPVTLEGGRACGRGVDIGLRTAQARVEEDKKKKKKSIPPSTFNGRRRLGPLGKSRSAACAGAVTGHKRDGQPFTLAFTQSPGGGWGGLSQRCAKEPMASKKKITRKKREKYNKIIKTPTPPPPTSKPDSWKAWAALQKSLLQIKDK